MHFGREKGESIELTRNSPILIFQSKLPDLLVNLSVNWFFSISCYFFLQIFFLEFREENKNGILRSDGVVLCPKWSESLGMRVGDSPYILQRRIHCQSSPSRSHRRSRAPRRQSWGPDMMVQSLTCPRGPDLAVAPDHCAGWRSWGLNVWFFLWDGKRFYQLQRLHKTPIPLGETKHFPVKTLYSSQSSLNPNSWTPARKKTEHLPSSPSWKVTGQSKST